MAQITGSPNTSPIADDLGTSASRVRSVAAGGLGRLRRSILPDHDHDFGTPDAEAVVAPSSLSHRLLGLLPKVLLALIALVFLLAVGLFAFRAMYSDKIYPAVVIGDINVGGLTPQQASNRLHERAEQLEEGSISFSYNGQVWTPSLSEIGATVDLQSSLNEATALGREGDATTRLAFTGDILRSDQVVPLQTSVNTAVLDSWFDKVDRDINNFAVNAAIVVDGTTITVSPDTEGVVVDREAAKAMILASLADLEPVQTDLPTRVDIPEIRTADLESIQAEVATAVTTPVRVRFENQSWKIEGATLAAYASAETVIEDGKPVAKLQLDTERLAADLRSQFGPEVNRDPEDARVGWNEGLVALDPSTTGITLRAGPFAEAVEQSFTTDHSTVTIPVVETRPTIDDENLGALGINELLGRGDSVFAGGPWARDENVRVGSSLLNGTLVPPGGTFSFNGAIGEITADKGYKVAAVVVAAQVGRDIGGGVCQVSTTMFRAALTAGMPISEWHHHTYRLPGYEGESWPAGYDASILQWEGQDPSSWADFKFENYSDSWLLVESWTSGISHVVNIYGTSDGRDVELDWWGISGGKNTGFTRLIFDRNGDVIAERAFPTYFK